MAIQSIQHKRLIFKMQKQDYYTTLEVSKTATLEEIKKAYKKLAVKWHPDKNPDNKDEATEKFRTIAEAYQILSDSEKRKKYDLYGFDGEKVSSTRFKYTDANDLFKNFFSSDQSFFSQFFSNTGQTSTSSRGTYRYVDPRTGQFTSPGSYSSSYQTSYTTTSKENSGKTEKEDLPEKGQAIKTVHHVTQKYSDGTQKTIKRTTTTFDDGSKEITEENLDGSNKKTHYVLGGSSSEPTTSSNFSGYNFGKRASQTDSENTNPSSTSTGQTYTRTYVKSGSGGTKVYYADGSEGVYTNSTGLGGLGGLGGGNTTTKVYYRYKQ